MTAPRIETPPENRSTNELSSTGENAGWRLSRVTPSLAEVYRSVPITGSTWWRKVLAFAGPGYLVAVGYMDPGNWATDLAGGSQFGYTLLSVILISNLMAVVLQGLASKLGIVSGRDLAQACRDHYSTRVNFALWVLCEIAIAACDLAEVIGTAIALNLLFGIPLSWGVAITALDVLIVLYLQNKGFRVLEALVIALVATVGLCFLFEIIVSRPDIGGVVRGFVPSASILQDPAKLYIAIGILGATVMPHNLYLHSSVVQTRKYELTREGKREAVRFAFVDSTIALSFALFINAAILIVAAATFHRTGNTQVAEIQDAYQLLSPLLGVGTAMVYPTLLAAIGDVAHPAWRASAVGVYRFWRDLGYAVGALVAGLAADALGLHAAIWLIATVTLASGVVVALRMKETMRIMIDRSQGSLASDLR